MALQGRVTTTSDTIVCAEMTVKARKSSRAVSAARWMPRSPSSLKSQGQEAEEEEEILRSTGR